MKMEYITLNNTDLKVSRFCMGGCPIGNYGWGKKIREQDFIKVIHDAIDSGINYFDTADTYGLGQSERTLAKGIKGHRNDLVIQSKFGVRVENGKTFYDNSPEYIHSALDASLARLDTDYLDVYVMHYWDGKTPPDEIVFELEALKKAGKIRCFGLSNIALKDLPVWSKYKDSFANIQYEFSLACRNHEVEIFQANKLLNVTPMTWGSLGQGVLTGKYDASCVFGSEDRRSRDSYPNFHGNKLLKNLEIVEVLRKISGAREKTITACALRFILDYIKDSVVIVGIKSSEQLFSNLESLNWTLTEEELSELNEISNS